MIAPALIVAPRMPAPALAVPTSAVDLIAGDVSAHAGGSRRGG